MPEYRIAPDQGACPDGHPCTIAPYDGTPDSALTRTCGQVVYRRDPCYIGPALVDVYVGPVGVEAFHEAIAALNALITNHEHNGCAERMTRPCPGVEVCVSNEAFALRAIQDALDPLPDDRMPCCGRRESEPHTAACPSALAQDAADGSR